MCGILLELNRYLDSDPIDGVSVNWYGKKRFGVIK
jgi:hypothetical protein